jgi:hypothetical protein
MDQLYLCKSEVSATVTKPKAQGNAHYIRCNSVCWQYIWEFSCFKKLSNPEKKSSLVRFKVLVAVRMTVIFFWVLTACRHIDRTDVLKKHRLYRTEDWYLKSKSTRYINPEKQHFLKVSCSKVLKESNNLTLLGWKTSGKQITWKISRVDNDVKIEIILKMIKFDNM